MHLGKVMKDIGSRSEDQKQKTRSQRQDHKDDDDVAVVDKIDLENNSHPPAPAALQPRRESCSKVDLEIKN